MRDNSVKVTVFEKMLVKLRNKGYTTIVLDGG